MNITFADLLLPGGIVIAGGIITTLVELLKRVLPAIDQRLSGALMAFVLSAVLYILAAVATEVREMNAGLTVFLAWLACATSAVGINSTITHVTNVSEGQSK
jgi:cobalamin biosynthesis protein CobD/CbiB